MAGVMDLIGGLFKPAKELISEFVEDKDKANEIRASLAIAQHSIQSEVLQLEGKIIEAQSAIVVAEAKSTSWLTSNWRPLTMVTFVGLVVAKWLGFTAPGISPEMELELMSLIKIGLGGYVIGRSAEKVLPSVAEVFTKK